MLSGDNGILQKATTAKENTDSAQIKERIQLAYHSALAEGQGSYTKESLEVELEKEFTTDYSVDDSDNDNWILTAKGISVTIPAGKEDTSKVTVKVETTNLKEVENLSTLYGQTTDYTSVSNVQWQLFYDDDEYIYLLANDYVPINTLPNELQKEAQAEGETKYKAWFSMYSDGNYTGTIMENEPWSKGTESSTITGNAQTSNYLKWVNSSIVETKNNLNMKAVAYMMDTSKWSSFAGSASGAYAIGGPTIEMFALSYNAKHDTKFETYGTRAEDITSTNADTNGYKVKIGDGSWGLYASGLDTSSDNMWVKTSNTKAYGYWLTAPSTGAGGSDFVSFVGEGGFISCSNVFSDTHGIRPLIAIPKSSLK